MHVCDRNVGKDHINALGHLEAGRYVVLFETAIAPLFSTLGLTDERLLATAADGNTLSPFLVEMHVTYQAELGAGDTVSIFARHLGHDARRARLFLDMTRNRDGRRAATCELMILNMDTASRKPAPWSDAQIAAWTKLAAHGRTLPKPAEAGRAIAPVEPPKSGG